MIRFRHLRDFLRGQWLLLFRSMLASVSSRVFRVPGREFEAYGRRLGIKATLAGEAFGPELWLTPVNITRYWEFPFVWRHLPQKSMACLDVASPRLFSLYFASRHRDSSVMIINPDGRDAEQTVRAALLTHARSVAVNVQDVSSIDREGARYDAVWSISVIEHIPDDGDVHAMKVMYRALAPGGRLLVTVPVDRVASIEYRPVDTYQLGLVAQEEGFFFQRWFDRNTIKSRLLDPLSGSTATLEWFGEREPGRFANYVQKWLRVGPSATVSDPLEIGRHYREYASWEDMPGQGVCGIAVTKPAA